MSATSTSLSPALELAAVRRLAWIASFNVVFIGVLFIARRIAVSRGFAPHPEYEGIGDALSTGFLAASVVVVWATRSKRWRPRSVLVAASGYEILTCLLASFAERLLIGFGQANIPLSLTVVVFLVFPVAVPMPRRQRVLTTGACVMAFVAGNLLASAMYAPIQSWPFWFFSVHTTLLVALLGHFLGGVVHDLGVRLEKAQRLGSYQLSGRLGAGGMGEVWRAHHTLLARPAAIKLIGTEPLGNRVEEAFARFKREARATARLRSPHTVEVYDFGTADDGRFYYVMELLDGIDLDKLVRTYGPLPPARAIHVLRQACRSLAEAHDFGLVHRDVKPGNIMLCRLGCEYDFTKVLDFGLVVPVAGAPRPEELQVSGGTIELPNDESAAGAALTHVGVTMGTPAYMAPEMIRAETPDGRTDIYSLGCVAYWLLAGRNPFIERSVVAMLAAHLERTPPTLGSVSEQPIPAALDALVSRCLAKDPGNRPPTADALDEELAAIAESYPWTRSDTRSWWDSAMPRATNRDHEVTATGPTVDIGARSSERVGGRETMVMPD